MSIDFIKIDGFENESKTARQDFNLDTTKIKVLGENGRKNREAKFRNFIAGVIIFSYIFIVILSCVWGFEIPEAIQTVSLIVVGYYFAKGFA